MSEILLFQLGNDESAPKQVAEATLPLVGGFGKMENFSIYVVYMQSIELRFYVLFFVWSGKIKVTSIANAILCS